MARQKLAGGRAEEVDEADGCGGGVLIGNTTLKKQQSYLRYYAHVARENALAAVVVLLVIAAAIGLTVRISKITTIRGQIEVLRIVATKEGSRTNAFIRLEDGSLITVRLPGQFNCHAGKRIMIQKSRAIFGYRYNTLPDACL